MDTWSIRKNKAKTKPIQSQYKPKTNPKQTQSKPIHRSVAPAEAGTNPICSELVEPVSSVTLQKWGSQVEIR
jgi:hypothetical protein